MSHLGFVIDRTAIAKMTSVLALLVASIGSAKHATAMQATEMQAAEASPTANVLSDAPWYDADRNEVVPVPVVTQEDDSIHRNSRWLPQPEKIQKSTNNTAGGAAAGNTAAGGLFGSGLTIGNVIGWLLLILVVAGTVGAIIYAMSRTEADASGKDGSSASTLLHGSDEQIMERMKHLPPELRRADTNLRGEAERLMTEGLFDQAIILLFGHQLLLLDRAGMLRLNRGKTNRRYVREVKAVDRATSERLALTVRAFERSYFGRHCITAMQFETLWAANGELEAAVTARREAAA